MMVVRKVLPNTTFASLFLILNHVELVQNQPAGFVVQVLIVALEFFFNGVHFADCLLNAVDFRIQARQVHQMQQNPGSAQVPEKQVSETRAFRCAFDQTRNVGHHKASGRGRAYDTEIWMQGCKRIVCNLWACVGDLADECGLACVGHAQQTNISKHFKLELDAALFTFLTHCELAWRSVGAGLEMNVAHSALTALDQNYALAMGVEVMQQFVGFRVIDDRSNRHAQGDVI
jgi:hypothetical protein